MNRGWIAAVGLLILAGTSPEIRAGSITISASGGGTSHDGYVYPNSVTLSDSNAWAYNNRLYVKPGPSLFTVTGSAGIGWTLSSATYWDSRVYSISLSATNSFSWYWSPSPDTHANKWMASVNFNAFDPIIYGGTKTNQIQVTAEMDTYTDPTNPLPDWWQVEYYGMLNVDPNGFVAWSNGLITNLQAYQQGLDPLNGRANPDGDNFTGNGTGLDLFPPLE